MGRLFAVIWQTFAILRRDKIFLPAAACGGLTLTLAHLASLWGIEEYNKILYDIGTAGFHITGAVVAILWGTKMVADSRQDGSIEVQLASPVSRTTWMLGKFLGLALALVMLGGVLIVFWQGLLMSHGFKPFEYKSMVILPMLMIGWLILAATAVFFAAMTSQAVAMFSCLCAWMIGLLAMPISNVLPPETPEMTRQVVFTVARIWDLGRFNLGPYAFMTTFPSGTEIMWLAAYGFFLVGTLLSLGCIFFSRRDLIG